MREASTASNELSQRLDATADLPQARGWTLRAATVPVERIFGDALEAGEHEQVIPVLIDATTGEMHHHPPVDSNDVAGHAIARIFVDWTRHVGRCPSRIDVDSASLASELRLVLTPLDNLVRHVPPEPSRDAGDLLLADLERAFVDRLRATPDQIHAHRTALRAAVACHTAQPWRVITRLDPVLFEAGLGPSGPAAAIVECVEDDATILLLPRTDIVWPIASGTEDPATHDGVWIVDFPALSDMDVFDRFAWLRSDFPQVGHDRWPRLRRVRRGIDKRDPAARDIDIPMNIAVAKALSALAQVDDATVDQGRWTVEVATAEGPVSVAMSWPDGQSVPSAATWRDRGVPSDPGAMLPRLLLLDRRRQRQSAVTPVHATADVDVDHIIDSVKDLSADQVAHELESEAATPREHADAMWAKALLTHGRARRRLAERAVERSHDCVGAWRMLAEITSDPRERARRLREAVAAGDRLRAQRDAGGPGSVPHEEMANEALFRLSIALRDISDEPGAIEAARQALARHPEDGHLRGMLAGMLVSRGAPAEALELVRDLSDSSEDHESHRLWVRAVAGFLVNGDTPWLRSAIAAAVEANIVTAHVLMDPRLLAAQQDPSPIMAKFKAEAALALRELRPAVAERQTFLDLVREAVATHFEAEERRHSRRFKQRKAKKR